MQCSGVLRILPGGEQRASTQENFDTSLKTKSSEDVIFLGHIADNNLNLFLFLVGGGGWIHPLGIHPLTKKSNNPRRGVLFFTLTPPLSVLGGAPRGRIHPLRHASVTGTSRF